MLFNSSWKDPVAPKFQERSKIHQGNMVGLLISLKIQQLKIMSSCVCKFFSKTVISNHHFPIKDKKDPSYNLHLITVNKKRIHVIDNKPAWF